MNSKKFTVFGVGDIILDAPNPDSYFDASRDLLKSADAVIGNIEVPHTERPLCCSIEGNAATAAPTEYLKALVRGGLTIGTIGGNHCFDQGPYGILDTIEVLKQEGIQTCGAGANMDEARTPAIVEKNGVKIAALHYNLTGPSITWATNLKAGAAYIRVTSVYENDRSDHALSPTTIYTVTDPRTKYDMGEDVRKAKEAGNHVIVYFHGGRPGSPDLMQYELECTHYAIDMGAEAVLCAHTHALSSIGVYHGKPIFFGLGNFVTVMKTFEPGGSGKKQARYNPNEWPGVQPWWECNPFKDMGSTTVRYYPFSDASRRTVIAKLDFSEEGLVSAGYIPCFINDKAAPEPVKREEKGEEIKEFLEEWTKAAKLDTRFFWNEDGTEVLIDLSR